MTSSRSKPERKCGLPAAAMNVPFVIPLGASAQGANLGRFPLVAQPWPSPGTGNETGTGGLAPTVTVPPVVVAPTSNALACSRASGRFPGLFRTDVVADHGPA